MPIIDSLHQMLRGVCLLLVMLAGSSVALAENSPSDELTAGDVANHIAVWAAPQSSVLAKSLHQMATDLRISKKITINYNLFQGYRTKHYLVDVYGDLFDATQKDALPDAAIVTLDEAMAISAHTRLAKLSADFVPVKRLSAELLELTVRGDNYIGAPMYGGDHLITLYNKNLISQFPQDWDGIRAIESLSASLDIHAITWQASSTQVFCSLMDCQPSDDQNAITDKLEAYQRLVSEFTMPMQCLTGCDTDLCELQCVQKQFFSEQAAMLVSAGEAIPEAKNQISNKLAVSAFLPYANPQARQYRYPNVFVVFADLADSNRYDVSRKVVRQYTRRINQKGLYFLAGKLPAHRAPRADIQNKLSSDSEAILDKNLRLLHETTELAPPGVNLFNPDFNDVLRRFLSGGGRAGDAAAEYLELRAVTGG